MGDEGLVAGRLIDRVDTFGRVRVERPASERDGIGEVVTREDLVLVQDIGKNVL